MKISNLGYVILSSPAPDAWRSFGLEVIGTMEAPAPDGAVALKIDEHPFRILVETGEADRLQAIGWEMASHADLAAMRDHLAGQGLAVRSGTAEEAEKRCVTEFFATTDPAGNPLEFYYGRTGCGEPFVSPIGTSGFVTGAMGLGHIVVSAAGAFEEAYRFYTTTLGLGDSDDLTIASPQAGMPDMRVRFLHADNPRHHSLALFNLPSPTGVVHLMLEMENLDEVGRCLDRVEARNISLMASLGRHCNDNMVSFYVHGPANVPLEIGCEGLQLDWTRFEPTVSTVPDHWGHAYQLGAE
ncbi:bleomycin resistance protein [Croceicoccus estronivorus]|uniref:VOC family protein n=1 Tax=Croceicoccus estronivorus TaxID=1172626 RepID=UPI0008366841|nr:VOC family protein [Croceicoccus estronivorus]OCC25603.1 bleomycin resistance protein [Croceicoccus estronivorus]